MKGHPANPDPSGLQRLAAFHQLSPNPVISVDAAGKVTFASDAAKRTLEPLGDKPSPDVFFPKDMDDILGHLRRRELATFRREVEIAGRVFEEDVHVRPEHDAVFIHAKDITELRRTEQELRRQDALLKALVESPSDIIIFALDREHRYTAFNTAHRLEMKKVYGVDIQLGMDLLDVISIPEVKAKAQRSVDRALAGESFYEVEVQPGLGIWYAFDWSPIRAPDGCVEGVTAFVQDITRRKRVETALADSEQKYRRLFESSNDAIMMLDTERFFDCNEATLKVFGYTTREEFLGKHPADVSPPRQADGQDSRDAANDRIATALRVGRNYFEWLHRRADGTVFPADVLLTPMDFHGQRVLQATVRDISVRKQSEAALRQTSSYLENLIGYANAPIIVWDPRFRITRFNRAFEHLTGHAEREVLGRGIGLLFPAERREESLDLIRRTATGERWETVEIPILRKDGAVRTVLWNSATLFGPDGKTPVATIAQGQDITERLQYRLQVEAERDKLRRILDVMPDGIYVVGRDHELQYVNPALLARGGPVDGRKCYDYFHGRTEPCPNCVNPQVFAGGSTRQEYVTQEGNVTWDIQDVPITGDDGRPARLAFMRDITERRQAELRDKQHLEDTTLLRDTALGFITLDPNADIYSYIAQQLARLAQDAYIVVNSYNPSLGEFRVDGIEGIGEGAEAVLKLLGRPPLGMAFRLSPEQLSLYSSSKLMKIDGGLPALSFGRMPKVVSDAIESVFGLGDIYAMSFYWQKRILGTVNIIMHKGVPLRAPAVVEAFVNQAAIAIQHHRDAKELVLHREHLEELVAERTAELEAANRELEAFSYSVSHDLRAPLRAIDGFAQALAEDAGPQLDERGRSHLERMRAAAVKMADLIDNLLNLARIARLPLERKPVDLGDLTRKIAADLRRAAPERTAKFVIPDDLIADADPVLAEMVLRNLLGNAWKFTSRHPAARIEVGTARGSGERIFFVRDDGVGFDMTYADKLFAPFQRLHSEREFPGSGIGLAIVQRIVRRHGGRVWFEAEVDGGATCWFTLEPVPKEA